MTKSLHVIYNDALKLVDNKNVFQQDILFLMKEILSVNETDVYIHGEKEYDSNQFDQAMKRLIEGEPVEYILGKALFYGEEFKVSNDTLIPRNCTEELVQKVVNLISKKEGKLDIIDIGSGSGCIALTLKRLLPQNNVESVDISEKALEIAHSNGILKGLDVEFYKSDCLDEPIKLNKKYDVIVSNPPYIDRETYVQESVLKYEPHSALFADNHGLAIYEKIFAQAKLVLKEKGLIAFEISPDLEKGLIELRNKYLPDYQYKFEKDMNDYIRFMYLYN